MHPSATRAAASPAAIVRWLAVLAMLIIAIIVVGGITRLTESGLSITRWEPVKGILPPLSTAEWQTAFARYRAIPQYGAVHAGMTLGEFKGIFFWEWGHRLLGRVIGLAAAGGWLWFWARRAIPSGYGGRLLAVPLLVGVQGTLGWLMVASGLKPGMTEVAPIWLAAHLLTALFTLSYVVWTALDLAALRRDAAARPAAVTRFAAMVGAVLAVQLLYGALMAGLRAGRVTDQWPLMNGRLFPGETNAGETLGTALVADPAIVHFIHRWWAWMVVALLIVLARRLKRLELRRVSVAIHSAFGAQLLLGIFTVWSGVALALAALHQLVGALLVVATVWGCWALGRQTSGAARQGA